MRHAECALERKNLNSLWAEVVLQALWDATKPPAGKKQVAVNDETTELFRGQAIGWILRDNDLFNGWLNVCELLGLCPHATRKNVIAMIGADADRLHRSLKKFFANSTCGDDSAKKLREVLDGA